MLAQRRLPGAARFEQQHQRVRAARERAEQGVHPSDQAPLGVVVRAERRGARREEHLRSKVATRE